MTEITLEQARELMQMLTGDDLPDGYLMTDQPALTPRQAFSVVWFLQERLGIIPNRFEQCSVCEELFDAHEGGHTLDPTGEVDGWQEELGVTQEILAASGGSFCSSECEAKYWQERIAEAGKAE